MIAFLRKKLISEVIEDTFLSYFCNIVNPSLSINLINVFLKGEIQETILGSGGSSTQEVDRARHHNLCTVYPDAHHADHVLPHWHP